EQLRCLESALQLGGEQRYDGGRAGRKLFGAGQYVLGEAARRETCFDGPGGELRALLGSLAAVAGPLDGGIDRERVGIGVEGRDALHVEGDLRFLVSRADQVVEHRGLGGRKLLIEEPRLAGVDRDPERGALG